MNRTTQQIGLARRVQVLLAAILALFVLGACDSLTEAPATATEPEPAVPATDVHQETVEGVELSPAATPGLYTVPSFQGTSVQMRIDSNYVDRYGTHYVNATWWGQNRGKPNLSILQYRATSDTRWHTVGGNPYLQNGYIAANYGIYPYRNAGPIPYNTNSVNNPSILSGPVYWRICTVGNYTNMPLTCGNVLYFRF